MLELLAPRELSCKFSPRRILGKSRYADHVELRGELGDRCARALGRISHEIPYSENYFLSQIQAEPSHWADFPCCHGDTAGRWIWAQSLAASTESHAPSALAALVHKAIALQQSDGHFGNTTIESGTETMLGAYGNGWMIKGLPVYASLFPDADVRCAVEKHVQWYIDSYGMWNDLTKVVGERDTGFYAVTPSGYFHGLDGLMSAFRLTGDKRILELGRKFLQHRVPLDQADHSHSYLTVRRGILALAEITSDDALTQLVAADLDAVWSRFITESGGVPERFIIYPEGTKHGDEACSLADWILLCLDLHQMTNEVKWLDRAVLSLENQLFYNQQLNGGFGARPIESNYYTQMGMEAPWCCSLYGPAALIQSAAHLVTFVDGALSIHHPIEGTFTFGDEQIVLSWSPELSHYAVDTAAAPSIRRILLRQPPWLRWDQSSEDYHEAVPGTFAAEWRFWNSVPGRAPEPAAGNTRETYTQFLGPWMLTCKASEGDEPPLLPNLQANGLLRVMHGLPHARKTLRVEVSSNLKTNPCDVFRWPRQPANQILLYPLKDKECPGGTRAWFRLS